ncbi:unnamed protein product [[Actinomadura] parvosata subsp. kistnae]|nr:unnamed protein product [Actinomadura parvosata subsp. kistnae]
MRLLLSVVQRPELAGRAGYCRSHSRWFWGPALHLIRNAARPVDRSAAW